MAIGLASMALLLITGQAQAASYPSGGSTFTGGAEGWTTKSAKCTVPLGLCSASGAYDGTAGNPAGSFADDASITLNVGGLFNATVSAESPSFKVGAGGAGTLSLQRQYVPGGLVNLTPLTKYTATVVDQTSGTETQAVSESLNGESGFANKGGAVSLVAGDTYAIRIDSEFNASVASVGLLGSSILRFDNVKLVDPAGSNGGGENGENGKNGGNGISSSELKALLQSSGLASPAILKGNRLFAKAKCPAKLGAACRVSLQGMLKKGSPATAARNGKVAKGKGKQMVLKVKPKARGKVATRHSLLFKDTVKVGKAKATVYKTLKLIRR